MHNTRLFTFLLASLFFSATAESVIAQTIVPIPLYTFDGGDGLNEYRFSVTRDWDINGDGMTGLIVEITGSDQNGLGSASASALSGFDGSVLYNFEGDTAGYKFDGSVNDAGNDNGDRNVLYNFYTDGALDLFGFSVSRARDANGDGIDDLIVGTRDAKGSGSTRVLSGTDGSVLYFFDGDEANHRLAGR